MTGAGCYPIRVEDIDRLRQVVEAHSGNLSSCARELGVTRQALTRRLSATIVVAGENVSLIAHAEQLRATGGVKGPRDAHGGVPETNDRARLVDAIAAAGGYRPAAAVLGLSASTMVRRMKRYGITPEEVTARREEVAPTES